MSNQRDDVVSELSARVQQLEAENAALQQQLQAQQALAPAGVHSAWVWPKTFTGPDRFILLQSIVENVPRAVYVWDISSERLLFANRRLRRLFSAAGQPGEGRTLTFLYSRIHPDDQIVLADMHKQLALAAEQQVVVAEYRWQVGHQEYRWFRQEVVILDLELSGSTRLGLALIRDITAEKFTTADVHRSAAFYHALELLYARELVSVLDARNRVLYCSPNLKRLLGYESAEVLGQDSFAFLHPDDLDEACGILEDVLAHPGQPFAFHGRLHHQNGSWRWIDATLCNLLDQPEVGGIVVHWSDISVRKEIEDRLRLFQAVVLNAADGVLVTEARPLDACGPRILYANPAFLKMTGYTPDEILGQTPRLLQGRRTDRAALLRVRQALEQYQSIQEELLNYRKDGSEYWVELSIVPVADENGHFVFFVAIHRDITGRKRAEQALRDSEERFRFLAHAVQDCISLTDTQRHTLYVNPACLKLTGYSEQEFYETHFRDRAHPEDRQRVAEAYQGNLRGETNTIQWRCQHKNGHYIWLETLATPSVDAAGQVSKLVCCSRDITERRRQEEERRKLEVQLQQAQKWESIGVLAGGIAHDFNNLLTSILGNASLALMDLPPDSPLCHYLQQIEDSSNRAAELCRQMLAYAGKGQFVIEPVEVSTLVEEMTNLLRAVISRKATLQLDLARSLPPVEGDATQLRQIILNLITNASDALQDNPGLIRISTRCIRADQELLHSAFINDDLPEGDYILIEVADNGCGMAPETLVRIFDPFYTTKFTGRGLGLAAVLGMVRSHHGTLRVHSQLGAGSTFQILLPPLSQPIRETTTTQPNEQAWCGSGVVLVIEDEAAIRDLAQQILQSAGFRVVLAVDGEEGLQHFTRNRAQFTAVLLDLTMPRLNGLETLRAIRQQSALPVILMSGYSEEDIRRQHADLTFQAFLQKPFSRTALLATLGRVLNG